LLLPQHAVLELSCPRLQELSGFSKLKQERLPPSSFSVMAGLSVWPWQGADGRTQLATGTADAGEHDTDAVIQRR